MKRAKSILIIVLFVTLLISLSFNISTLKRQRRGEKGTINYLHTVMIYTSNALNEFVTDYQENNITEATSCLEYASEKFQEIDNIITNTNIYANTPIYNPPIYSFEFIGNILAYSSCQINDYDLDAILSDNKISENEYLFVKKLRDDFDKVYEHFSLLDPYTPNLDLSIDEVNEILKDFYSAWAEHPFYWETTDSKSPYKLLLDLN